MPHARGGARWAVAQGGARATFTHVESETAARPRTWFLSGPMRPWSVRPGEATCPPRERAGPTSWVRLGVRLDGQMGSAEGSACRPPAPRSRTAGRSSGSAFSLAVRVVGPREREREPMPTDVRRGGDTSLTSVPTEWSRGFNGCRMVSILPGPGLVPAEFPTVQAETQRTRGN